jgi:hypothetical protein
MSHPNKSSMDRHLQRFWILAGVLCAWGGPAATAQTPEVADLQNGYVSWSNANTNLYYTLEHSSALTNGSPWDGACREWQDLRSTSNIFTVPIGRFYRVVASSNPLHTASLSPTTTAVNAGFYETTNLAAVDADLVSANVRSGVSIFGVAGTPAVVNTASGNATTNQILAGRVAWVNGAAITGAIPARALSATTTAVNAGYYAGTNLNDVDVDLASANVRAGSTIFGVAGNPFVVNTGSGNAVAENILVGNVAWVDGVCITGSLPTCTLSATSTAVNAGFYFETALDEVDPDLLEGNVRSGVAIFGVTGAPAVVNTASGNATSNQILAGRVAWANGAAITGAIPTRTLADTTTVVNAGNYAATNLVAVDPDLVATNLRAGVSLFGVAGSIPPAAVPKTGSIENLLTGDDGTYQAGVAWPSPRFTTGSSTSSNCVTDNLTGLTWLRNPTSTLRNCSNSIAYCEGLTGASGRGNFTDWRLPNVREMQSLVDYENRAPALPAVHPFLGVAASNDYWTGTVVYTGGGTKQYFAVSMDWGSTAHFDPTNLLCAWPVRGGL